MGTYQDSLFDLAKAGVYEVTVPEACTLYLGGVYRFYHLAIGTHYIHNPLPRNVIYVSKPLKIEGSYLGHPVLEEKRALPTIKSITDEHVSAENLRLSGTIKTVNFSVPLGQTLIKFINAFSTLESKLSIFGITHQFTGSILVPLRPNPQLSGIYWDLKDYQYSLIEFYDGTIYLPS